MIKNNKRKLKIINKFKILSYNCLIRYKMNPYLFKMKIKTN